MSQKTNISVQNTLQFMQGLSWFVLISLIAQTAIVCIGYFTGDFLFRHDEAVINTASFANKSALLYLIVTAVVLSTLILKVILLFKVTQLFKKVRFDQPFTKTLVTLITVMTKIALAIGILTAVSKRFLLHYTEGLREFTIIDKIVEGPKVFIFFAGLLFIIAQFLKRGLEIQEENDLTI